MKNMDQTSLKSNPTKTIVANPINYNNNLRRFLWTLNVPFYNNFPKLYKYDPHKNFRFYLNFFNIGIIRLNGKQYTFAIKNI